MSYSNKVGKRSCETRMKRFYDAIIQVIEWF